MSTPLKILIVFGTRPEAIKMAPLVKELYKHADKFIIKICVTAQHRKMLDQVLHFFEIKPNYDLDLMEPGQNLFQLSAKMLLALQPVLEDYKPDFVIVHGDTTTSTIAALSAFYAGAKVAHVEAGLRTFDKWAPFPEEMNRKLTGGLSDIHFAPTVTASQNLLKEGCNPRNIIITGNTVVDALLWASAVLEDYEDNEIISLKNLLPEEKRLILVTGHRRENFGDGFLEICQALKEIAIQSDVVIIYPVHLNPQVKDPVYKILGDVLNIKLIEPLGYPAFVWLMKKSYLIITDSGGVQEEAPGLGKPLLIMRDKTERDEVLQNGTAILVGAKKEKIVAQTIQLLNDESLYNNMIKNDNPFGTGNAAKNIVAFFLNVYEEGEK